MLNSMKKPLYPHPSKDGLTIDYDKEDFNKSLPFLAKELGDNRSQGRLQINGIEQDPENPQEEPNENAFNIEDDSDTEISIENGLGKKKNIERQEFKENFVSQSQEKRKKIEEYVAKQSNSSEFQELYNPKAEDFIRRCNTLDQAEEVIEYLLKRKEISMQDAQTLRDKLKKEGLTSYGPKKSWGYFERKYRRGAEIKKEFDD